MNGISLCAKWLKSENTHSKESRRLAKKTREYLGMTSKQYRQMLSKLRTYINVLEKLMSANRWDEINFSTIPSKAGLVYRNAFARRDILAKKYEDFIKNKNTKVNAGTLYPYEIVEKALKSNRLGFLSDGRLGFTGTDIERAALGKFWESQPDYLEGKDCSMMCVIDTSGSMYGRPMNVAISLGLYCAERMRGPFAGKYISFASRPRLIKTEGVDFVDKVFRIYKTNLVDNTNLNAVFDLLLHTAMEKGVYVDDLPKTIVVISDMEIDYGSNWSKDMINLEMENMRIKWASCGFKLPKLVYWNVNARNNTILDTGSNITFVSGCSPVIFKQVLTGKTGIELMMETLMDKRYVNIHA